MGRGLPPAAARWVESLYPGAAASASPLAGHGSDRRLFRFSAGRERLVVALNPLPPSRGPNENDSFVYLSRHLGSKGLPLPRIHAYERELGCYVMDDLGGEDLCGIVASGAEATPLYREATALLARLQTEGSEGFDPSRCHSPPRYDRALMREAESGYFEAALLRDRLGLSFGSGLSQELDELAALGSEAGAEFFLHRDFQSRNLKVHRRGLWIIDFQSARLGPPQYDLAALLYDPYTDLPRQLRRHALEHYLSRFCPLSGLGREEFLRHLPVLAAHRLMQALGAFATLGARGKEGFLPHIPAALRLLAQVHAALPGERFPHLGAAVAEAAACCGGGGER